MDAFLEAVANLDLWQVIGAALVVVAGSSAASALITSLFANSLAKGKARREARSSALTSIGNAYAVYLTVGNSSERHPSDDAEVAEVGAVLLSETAKVGQGRHLDQAEAFRQLGELFSGKDEDVNVGDLQKSFLKLIGDLSDGIRK